MRINHILVFIGLLFFLAAGGLQLVSAATSQLDLNENHSVSDLRSPDATVIYVKADAAGANDGTSWADAYTDLQAALGVATSGDEIWTAAGTYKPGTERTDTFELKNGVAIYGGFNGTETGRDEQDSVANLTTLSGDLNGDDNDHVAYDEPTRAENSYNVVTGSGTDESAVLDGFTITAGNASGDGDDFSRSTGGGVYNNNGHPTISNVILSRNSALNDGGGMYNYHSNPSIRDVTLIDNSTNDKGGGIFNYTSSPLVTNAAFISNVAVSDGGGMYNFEQSHPTIRYTTFTSNIANDKGGGVFNHSQSHPLMSYVTLDNNSANDDGGGMCNWNGSNPILSYVIFRDNSANEVGGGMCNKEGSNPILHHVTFVSNSAKNGGGIYNHTSDPIMSYVTLDSNSATYGGGMQNDNSNLIVNYVMFRGNSATVGGGAIYNWSGSPKISNALFSGNLAQFGGAINNDESRVEVSHATFSANLATNVGGGIYNNDSNLAVDNSVLWNNKDGDGIDVSAQLHHVTDDTGSVSYSIIQGWYAGTGNLDTDPFFVSPINPDDAPTTAGDFRLQSTSLAIDAGNNSLVPTDTLDLDHDNNIIEPLPWDLDGRYRLIDGPVIDTGVGTPPIVDMGAYEYSADVSIPQRMDFAPEANTHTVPLTTSVSITYDLPISPTTVSTRTFAIHAMQTGQLLEGYNMNGNQITLTSNSPFKPGELVQVSATTGTLSLADESSPIAPTVWQFRTAVTGGAGFFSDSGQSLGSADSWSVALGDLDHDGDLDAFVGRKNNKANKVWLNNGNGIFTDSGQNLGNSSSTSVALGDIDSDGDLDALIGNSGSLSNVVWLNNGTGIFSQSQSLGNANTFAVALGDVDGDGDLDVFIGNNSAQANELWLNDSTGFFTDSGQSLGTSLTIDIALADIDQDYDLDAFVANTDGQANQVWLNDGAGFFTDSGQSPGNLDSEAVALADVDGDNDVDAMIANNSGHGNQVWLNNGTGTFSNTSPSLGNSDSFDVMLGDIDGDHDLDAFVANKDNLGNKVWLNDGSGTFTDSGQSLGTSPSRAVALGDLNDDGNLDALVVNQGEGFKVWLNDAECTADKICNGGFEEGIQYWNYSRDTEIVSPGHTGEYAIRSSQYLMPTQTVGWVGFSQEIEVMPGQLYDYSFWLKAENAANGHLKFIWFNTADEPIGTSYPVRDISGDLNDWTEFAGQVVAPLDATKAEMIIWHGANEGVNVPGSTLWVDDITVTPAPNIVAIYALAFDNPLTSTYSLAPQFPEAMQSIVDATIETPDKMAIVLVDLPGEGNTHIRKVHNGVEELIPGLPDADGNLSFAIDEYDMADGEALGGFLTWALSSYSNANSKTIFSYVGHGAALVPESDYQLLPDSRQMQRQDPIIPLPLRRKVHPNYSDYETHSILSPYDLAQALEIATNDGQNPIDVLDLVQCFSGTIEQFYELSNPGGQPYAKTISGSPNFTYMSPKMLGVALSASQPTDEAETLATTLISTYNTVLAEDDEENSEHPRLLVAMDSSKIAGIKTAWNNMATLIEDALAEDRVGTKQIIVDAYQASAKYDTTFCEADWALDNPDALVDMVDFAYRLSDEFGFFSEAGMWAEATKIAVEDAIIAKHYTSGKPWLSSHIEPQPEWDFEPHAGIALYADFMGKQFGEETLLSWQAHWYTDEVSADNPSPYAFVRDTQWDQVLQSFWDGENVGTQTCLPPLLPAQRDGEVSAKQILFPMKGSVTTDTPVLPVAIIEVTAADTPLSPQVKFEVMQQDTVVFSNTVSAGVVTTGTHQVEASQEWLPRATGKFTLTVTVDADNRIAEVDEGDNIVTQISRVSVQPGSPRPIIEATVNDGQQTITSNQVPLGLTQDAETSSAPVGTIAIQVYQYDNDENPNIYVPKKKAERVLRNMSLPQATLDFTLPNDLKPGPVVLHVWGLSGGGLNAKPQVIKFNYLPPATSIAAGEADYFTFQAKQGQNLHLLLDLLDAGDANLFAWDPLNYGRPIWRATDIGDDQINIESVPLNGEYIVGVYGETDATYTLSHSLSARIAKGAQSGAEANPEADVPAARPIFIEPTPELPEIDVPLLCEMTFDNTDSDVVEMTGEWKSSSLVGGFVGDDYLHDNNSDKGNKSVRFTPQEMEAGTYEVQLNWTAANKRASNVPVEIKHANGTESVIVNQRENGGQWNALGSYTFAGDGTEYVEIRTDGTDGTDNYVIADALRLVSVDCMEERISLQPTAASQTITQSEIFTVAITANNVLDLYATRLELSFDPTILQVVDMDEDKGGVQIEHGILEPEAVLFNTADNTTGIIKYAISLQGKKPGISEDGPLATITFRAAGLGTSGLQITQAHLLNSQANNIHVDFSDADVSVIAPVVSISGDVFLEEEDNHSGTQVCVADSCVTTNAGGSYILHNLPLTGTVEFTHTGYVSQTLEYEGMAGQHLTLEDVTLEKEVTDMSLNGKVRLSNRGENHYEGVEVCIEARCMTTEADGVYEFDHLPLQGIVTFSHPSYLTATLPYEGVAGEVKTLDHIELQGGDPSKDGQVNIEDAVIVTNALDTLPGDARWDARADINGDGKVDFADFVIVQLNWGKESIETGVRLANRASVGGDTQVLITPANSRLSNTGESLVMQIDVQEVNNLQAASVVVTFNPALLQVADANPNLDGTQIRSGDFLDETNQLIVINQVDNQAGIIEFAVTQTYLADARNGDGVLASISFDSIGEGHSTINLTEARLVDNSTPDPQVIPVTTQNGSVLIGQQKLYLPMMMRP